MVAGSSPIDVHRVEMARAILLLRDLTVDDWTRPVDPPEFAGWTVHDVVVHLVANESLLARPARRAGAGHPRDRHRQRGPHRPGPGPARRPAAGAGGRRVGGGRGGDAPRSRPAARPASTSRSTGGAAELPTWMAVLVRAFETWTHADDIRRAIGAGMVVPPPASLLTMAHAACGLVPRMLRPRRLPSRAARPVPIHRPRRRRLGRRPGSRRRRPSGRRRRGRRRDRHRGRSHLSGNQRRIGPAELEYTVFGDDLLVSDIIDALPALAVL